MELSSFEIQLISKRLLSARTGVLLKYPFYGLLLMHLKFAIDDGIDTAATDGEKIYFNPEFISKISDAELKFILMHEVLHAALCHTSRGSDFLDKDLFNIACDIVVNSTILKEDRALSAISVGDTGSSMHKTPNGEEGYLFTAEEVYGELCMQLQQQGQITPEDIGCGEFDQPGQGEESNSDGQGQQQSKGKNKSKDGQEDQDGGNNSEDQDGSQSGKQKKKNQKENQNGKDGSKEQTNNNGGRNLPKTIDSHAKWNEKLDSDRRAAIDEWHERIKQAAEAVKNFGGKGQGNVPGCIDRLLKELNNPQIDWREALNAFIQEDIVDYSFNPPDVRFQDSEFILPAFTEKEEEIKNVIFMVDTSGSMADEDIADCYSEIKGAIDQFNGHLKGYVGFFDTQVYSLDEFESVDDILKLRPKGGGGTSFHAPFNYLNKYFDEEISSIIILTDGVADMPDIGITNDVPVLWIILGNDKTMSWGKTINIEHSKNKK